MGHKFSCRHKIFLQIFPEKTKTTTKFRTAKCFGPSRTVHFWRLPSCLMVISMTGHVLLPQEFLIDFWLSKDSGRIPERKSILYKTQRARIGRIIPREQTWQSQIGCESQPVTGLVTQKNQESRKSRNLDSNYCSDVLWNACKKKSI